MGNKAAKGWRLHGSDALVLSEITVVGGAPTDGECPVCGERSVACVNDDSGLEWISEDSYVLRLRCEACGALIRETWRTGEQSH